MSETSPDTPKVFISYRRSESGGHAGRLYDAMAARFGERNVFMDVALQPGVDFVERITAATRMGVLEPRTTIAVEPSAEVPRG